MSIIRLMILFLVTLLFTQINTYNGKRSIASQDKTIADLNFRRNFISLEKSFNYRGLFHNGEDSEYIRRLFGQILQKADQLAKDDWYSPEDDLFKHYNLFLLLSTLVPHHESGLMHFTKRDTANYCFFSNDILDPVFPKDYPEIYYPQQLELEKSTGHNPKTIEKNKKKYDSIVRNTNLLKMYFPHFTKAMGTTPFEVKHCSKINTSEVYQLMFSGDYADVGMFMLNAKSHGGFFSGGGILNFDEVKKYALSFLYDGFKEISLNSSSYSCLSGLDKSNFYQYSENLLRGAWAGKYNSGRTSQTCRFEEDNHKFSSNDIAFKNSLSKFLNEDYKIRSLFHKYLPDGSIEKKAFLELIENIKEQKNSRIYIDQVLASDYHQESEMILTDENDFDLAGSNNAYIRTNNMDDKPVSMEELPGAGMVDFDFSLKDKEYVRTIITTKNVNLRSKPLVDISTECANTKDAHVSPLMIEVINQTGDWIGIHNNIEGLVVNESCLDNKLLYVHKSLVKMSKDYSKLDKIKINQTVTFRDKRGEFNSVILGTLPPSEVYFIEAITLDDLNVWVEFVTPEGNTAWFYGGELNSPIFEKI